MTKYAIFTLSMPKVGSWNGKWSGSDQCHVTFRQVDDSQLNGRQFDYDFEDGWQARISVRVVESQSIVQESIKDVKNFAGYDWMVDSILRFGEIKTGTYGN